jgi:hypothetical protein
VRVVGPVWAGMGGGRICAEAATGAEATAEAEAAIPAKATADAEAARRAKTLGAPRRAMAPDGAHLKS